jgi:eukaryotic-like serine/threonine-protein kinase
MEAVEARVLLDSNAMMIDLFDSRHAKKVLVEFGRGYGRLEPEPTAPNREQTKFLDQVISNLTTDGKIFPVHLSLFAETVKSREWSPDTLKALGGTIGVGEQFLNESFSASYAPAPQRAHEEAAKRLLAALLPDDNTAIKANSKTYAELLEISGYQNDPTRFRSLLQLMEGDLKLISSSDSMEASSIESTEYSVDQTRYQLSHDFLVPSIRDWLASKQRATFVGRLHRSLSEQTMVWSLRRESSIPAWFLYRTLIPKRNLTPNERAMLAVQDSRSWLTIAAIGLVMLGLFFGVRDLFARADAKSLLKQLKTATIPSALQLIESAAQNSNYLRGPIDQSIAGSDPGSQTWFVLQAAKLKWDTSDLDIVFQRSLNAPTDYVPLLSNTLKPFTSTLADRYWSVLDGSGKGAVPSDSTPSQNESQTRFRAAQYLVALDPPILSDADGKTNHRWTSISEFAANQLVQTCEEHPDQFNVLFESMQPIATLLIPHLSKAIGAEVDSSNTRFALSLLMRYTSNQPELQTQQCLGNAIC